MAEVHPIPTSPRFINLVGKPPFGKLTVIAYAGRTPGSARWLCHCECGGETIASGCDLKSGHTRTCGCGRAAFNRSRTKHGCARQDEHTNEFEIWKTLKQRCCNPKNPTYRYYGARGIRICLGYRDSFVTFLGDLGERPSKKHSIDRRENSGHYSCGRCEECLENNWSANCRWATRVEQNNNTRRNRRLTYNDQTHTVAEWARILGIRSQVITDRLRWGWSVEEIFTIPVGGFRRRS